jgi:hypothetical protein
VRMYAQKESRRVAHGEDAPQAQGEAAKVSPWPQPTSGTS